MEALLANVTTSKPRCEDFVVPPTKDSVYGLSPRTDDAPLPQTVYVVKWRFWCTSTLDVVAVSDADWIARTITTNYRKLGVAVIHVTTRAHNDIRV